MTTIRNYLLFILITVSAHIVHSLESPTITTHGQRFVAIAQTNENSQSNFSWIPPYNSLFSWIYAHKLRVVALSSILSLLSVQGYIWSLEHTIQNHQWSAWNQEYQLEELQALSDNAIQKELLVDIKKTYPSAKHDYATSFLAFLDALKREETDIELFQSISTTITGLPLLSFVTYNKQLLTQCPRRLAQIRYLRNRLINTFIK